MRVSLLQRGRYFGAGILFVSLCLHIYVYICSPDVPPSPHSHVHSCSRAVPSYKILRHFLPTAATTHAQPTCVHRVVEYRLLCLYIRTKHIPWIMVTADFIFGIASGMTIKFFPLFFKNEVALTVNTPPPPPLFVGCHC